MPLKMMLKVLDDASTLIIHSLLPLFDGAFDLSSRRLAKGYHNIKHAIYVSRAYEVLLWCENGEFWAVVNMETFGKDVALCFWIMSMKHLSMFLWIFYPLMPKTPLKVPLNEKCRDFLLQFYCQFTTTFYNFIIKQIWRNCSTRI